MNKALAFLLIALAAQSAYPQRGLTIVATTNFIGGDTSFGGMLRDGHYVGSTYSTGPFLDPFNRIVYTANGVAVAGFADGDFTVFGNLRAAAGTLTGTAPASVIPTNYFCSMAVTNTYLFALGSATAANTALPITNYASVSFNGFTTNRLFGRMTNSFAGWYRCFYRFDILDDPSTTDEFQVRLYTNGVPVNESLCSIGLISSDAFVGAPSGLQQPFSAEVFFYLPANTWIEARLNSQQNSMSPSVLRGNFNVMGMK